MYTEQLNLNMEPKSYKEIKKDGRKDKKLNI